MGIIQRLRCEVDDALVGEMQSTADDDNAALVRRCRRHAGTCALVGGALVAAVVMWTTRTRYPDGGFFGGFFKIYLGLPALVVTAVPVYFVANTMCTQRYKRRMHRYDHTGIGGDRL